MNKIYKRIEEYANLGYFEINDLWFASTVDKETMLKIEHMLSIEGYAVLTTDNVHASFYERQCKISWK